MSALCHSVGTSTCVRSLQQCILCDRFSNVLIRGEEFSMVSCAIDKLQVDYNETMSERWRRWI